MRRFTHNVERSNIYDDTDLKDWLAEITNYKFAWVVNQVFMHIYSLSF